MKSSRWYEVEGDVLYVYDQPYKKYSQSVSIVGMSDMSFYRNSFHLRKIWG